MIRRLLRRVIRIGAVVGAILFLIQIFLRNPRPTQQDSSAPAARPKPDPTPPAPAPAAKAPAAPKAAAPASTSNGADETAKAWTDPVEGACPSGYPVKVKVGSGIFHVPGGLAYDRTTPDRCYRDAESAEADGFRQSKR